MRLDSSSLCRSREKSSASQTRAGSSVSHDGSYIIARQRPCYADWLTLVDAIGSKGTAVDVFGPLPRFEANPYSRCRVQLETARARDSTTAS